MFLVIFILLFGRTQGCTHHTSDPTGTAPYSSESDPFEHRVIILEERIEAGNGPVHFFLKQTFLTFFCFLCPSSPTFSCRLLLLLFKRHVLMQG